MKFRQDWNETRKRAKILISTSNYEENLLSCWVMMWETMMKWKHRKKWSFRTQSGGALNWPAIMLLENEDYVSIDMKLIRNKENNRITFNSNIWTHHLKECSSIRQHQKRTRKQKRLETKSNRTSSSPHHWEMMSGSTADSSCRKQNFNGSVWQTYTDHPI